MNPEENPRPPYGSDRIQSFIFDRELNNISILRWTELYSNFAYVVIGRTEVNNILISTVWTGISFPKLPFETVIFINGEPTDCEKHGNEDIAKEYHLQKVKFYLELERLGALPLQPKAKDEENNSEHE